MNFAQIVVYRSPWDKWVWESGLGWAGTILFWLLAVAYVIYEIAKWSNEARGWRKRK